MKIYFLQLFIAFGIVSSSFAQLKEANDLFDNFEYREAIKYFEIVENLDEENRLKLAFCYFRIHDFKNAHFQFSNVISTEGISPINYHFYGICLKNIGRFDEARVWFLRYQKLDSLDFFNNLNLEELEFQESQYLAPERLELINLTAINSGLSEFCPRYFKDGFIYCDEVKFDESNKRPHIDYGNDSLDIDALEYGSAERPLAELYYVPITGDMHGSPTLMAEDDHFHIGDFDIDEITGEIYFTKIDLLNKWNPQARSHPRLFKAKFDTVNKKLVDVKKVKVKKLHDEDGSGHPTLSADGNRMYFSSNRPNGYGGSDLYYTEKLPNGNWDEPINLGDEVNTPGDELYPYLFKDSCMYFSSNGHIGFGGLDLFKVLVDGSEASKREILPKPLNSESDDIGLLLNENNTDEGFVVSNRFHGGFGDDDIFRFKLKLDDSYVQGVVRNEDGSVAPNALVKLLGVDGHEIQQLKTDENGKYFFDLDSNETYHLIATTNGRVAKKQITLGPDWSSKNPLDLTLMPAQTVQGFVLDQVGGEVAAATVYLLDDSGVLLVQTSTDDKGRYQLALENNKKYTVVARIKGFQGEIQALTDDSWDTNQDSNILLLPTEVVQGVISDSTGKPIAGALVKLLDNTGVEIGQIKTDSNGFYSFTVPPGNYQLVASINGLGAKENIAIDENWNGDNYLNMVLLPMATIQGTVFDINGFPAAKSKIILYDERGAVLVQSWTDEKGKYQFVLTANSSFDIVAEKENLKGNAHVTTNDSWDNHKATDINLTNTTIVSGIILDNNGNPVEGATVKLYDDDGNLIATVTTGTDGKYQFILDRDENYQIVASIDGFEGVANIFTGDNWNEDHIVQINLMPTGTPTKGLVSDNKDGKGIEGVKVTLIDNESDSKIILFTDNNGLFDLALSPNRSYTLNLDKEGYYPKSIIVNAGEKLPEVIDLNKEYDLAMDYAGYDVNKIYFDYDKSTLTEESLEQLDKLAETLKENVNALLFIKSYADCRGPDKYNTSLSWLRSKAVKEYLVNKGIGPERIGTKSMGATNFVNNCIKPMDCTEKEHAVNRRSEFEIKFK